LCLNIKYTINQGYNINDQWVAVSYLIVFNTTVFNTTMFINLPIILFLYYEIICKWQFKLTLTSKEESALKKRVQETIDNNY
jgi:hypothetical protein